MARRSRRRSAGSRKGRKGFPWLLAGAAGVGAFFLHEHFAKAAPDPQVGPAPTPGPNVPAPTPATSIPAGRYQVTTKDVGPAGSLALRATATVDPTDANLIERLDHLTYVQASGVTTNGFAAVMAPDQKTGWASLAYLTYAP